MLFQRVDDFCKIILKKSVSRVQYIIENIPHFYSEYHKFKTDKLGNRRKNKAKYVDRFGEFWTRPINPPHEELKSIQKRINRYLVKHIPFPEYAYGGIKGKDNITNALAHKGIKFVFQTDLKDFYPFITNKMVYDMFVNNGFSPDVASLLTRLTTYKGHLPQGSPTSTTIANLVFVPTGLKLQKLANDNGLRFTTFVDDITLSSQNTFQDIIPEIIRIITDNGFKISQGKTTYKSGITEITGVKLPNNTMTTTDKFRKKYMDIDSLSTSSKNGALNYKNRIKKLANTKPHKRNIK